MAGERKIKNVKTKKAPARAGKKKKITRKYKKRSYVKKVENILDVTVSDDAGKKKTDENANPVNKMADKETSGTGKFTEPVSQPYPPRTAIGFKSDKTKKNQTKK